jgi:hypothetical protein
LRPEISDRAKMEREQTLGVSKAQSKKVATVALLLAVGVFPDSNK